ncbi:MAG: biliverdin-producing heme oxygenase [Hansschlegelia sp.]
MTIAMTAESESRLARLRLTTAAEHDRLDKRILAGRPFESRERYGLFLRVQHGFHSRVDGAYRDPALNALIPELAARSRLAEVVQDFADLGMAPDKSPAPPALALPEALGWLYVSEGSNLGAAFLLKEAAKLGLSAEFGARHLAPHPDGRGLNWRRFKTAVDAIVLSLNDEGRVDDGAQAAFRHVRELVDNILEEN